MKSAITSIDAAGNVLVPEGIREEAGFVPGMAVEIRFSEGHLEIEKAPNAIRIEEKGGVFVAVPAEPLPPLSAEFVRETQEAIRHRQLED